MKTQATCPHCHSSQALQRVATVVANRTRVGYIVSPEQISQVTNRQTNLGELLAPPPRPKSGGWLLVLLLAGLFMLSIPASCVLAMIFTALQGDTTQAAIFSGQAERLFLLIIGLTGLASIIAVVLVAQWLERRQRPALEQWNRQMVRWQQAWFCYHCHVAFIPGSPKTVAPERIAQMLAT